MLNNLEIKSKNVPHSKGECVSGGSVAKYLGLKENYIRGPGNTIKEANLIERTMQIVTTKIKITVIRQLSSSAWSL